MILSEPFTADERDAWLPPPDMTVSDWADEHRVLTPKESAEPGRWRTDRTPYMREIQDCFGDPDIDLVVVKKPAQQGISEATRNFIGYAAALDPGPLLLVYPSELATREQVEERLMPLVRNNLDSVTTDKAHDLKLTKLSLTSMDIFVGWATSPQRLASRPVRYVVLDEVNKYQEWSGKDADPIALAVARTRTWGRRKKIIVLSTPTIPDGQISKAFDACEDQRHFVVPCPECGCEFEPVWSRVKWPQRLPNESRKVQGARIKAEQLAWIECPDCAAQIDETARQRIIRQGRWKSSLEGIKARSVGFAFCSLVSPWVNISELAAKFLMVKDEPPALMEFVNQDLGEHFEQQEAKIEDAALADKVSRGYARGIVPAWAGALLVGVDSQKTGFYWCVRAYGRGQRSRLIDHGFANTLQDLSSVTLDRPFAVEGSSQTLQPQMLVIDARGGTAATTADGSRTDEVYRWSLTDPRVVPMVGHGGNSAPTSPIRRNSSPYKPPGSPASYRVERVTIWPDYFKDILAARIRHADPDVWQLHGDCGHDYIAQITSERRVLAKVASRMVMTWKPKAKHSDNHFWDCETMLVAAAQLANVEHLPDEKTLRQGRDRAAEQDQQQDHAGEFSTWVDGRGWWS